MPLELDRLVVLLVDDNSQMRSLIHGVLRSFGVGRVLECGDGSDAIDILKTNPVDIVFCDWVMEPVDGLEFVRRVRTSGEAPHPQIPIVMLTGHTERYRIEEARDAGVTEFLAKPVNAEAVYARIRSVVENPRTFVRAGEFSGPDRRRRKEGPPGEGRRATDEKSAEKKGDEGDDDSRYEV